MYFYIILKHFIFPLCSYLEDLELLDKWTQCILIKNCFLKVFRNADVVRILIYIIHLSEQKK